MARRRLPKSVFEFVDGGAGQELTLQDNRAGFERIRLLPRVLTDVSQPDLATTLWSKTYPTPLVISPMGSCALVRPGADIAIATAAAARGIPYTLSTMATTGIERMARAVQGPLWFQLYVLKDFDFNRRLVRQAEEFGYSALVVTVDLQAGGKREKGSFRLAFAADLRAPDAFFFCCQRVAYPAADRSHLTAHENGVTALRGIVMASDRPQDFAAALQDVFHAPARAESTLAITARNADIEVTPRETFTARFGWKPAMHGPGLMLGGVVFRTSSLEALERLFARNGVAFEKRGGRLIVAPAEGQGTLFLFEGSQT